MSQESVLEMLLCIKNEKKVRSSQPQCVMTEHYLPPWCICYVFVKEKNIWLSTWSRLMLASERFVSHFLSKFSVKVMARLPLSITRFPVNPLETAPTSQYEPMADKMEEDEEDEEEDVYFQVSRVESKIMHKLKHDNTLGNVFVHSFYRYILLFIVFPIPLSYFSVRQYVRFFCFR